MLRLKSKIMSVVVGLMFAGALVGAQASKTPAKIKNVRQQINLSQDVKVGSTVLKSGQYQVTSKNEELTFRRLVQDPAYISQWILDTKEKPTVVKCTITVLEAKARGTEMDMPADSSGVAVLKTITLDDTNVKFTIGQ